MCKQEGDCDTSGKITPRDGQTAECLTKTRDSDGVWTRHLIVSSSISAFGSFMKCWNMDMAPD